jgi:hypothetical protein
VKNIEKQEYFSCNMGIVIEGDQALKEYITSYYKDLFGPPKPSSFSLDESRMADIEQVSPQENDLLTSPFTMDSH